MQSGANATGRPSSCRQMLGDRLQAELRLRLALRPAEMRREDHRRAVIERVGDRRQRRANAGVVGDPAVLDRDVEVDADEHAPAVEAKVVNVFICPFLIGAVAHASAHPRR